MDKQKKVLSLCRFSQPAVLVVLVVLVALVLLSAAGSAQGAVVDPVLQAKLGNALPTDVISAVFTYEEMPSKETLAGVTEAGLSLQSFKHLPMVVATGTPAQLSALLDAPGLLSVYRTDRTIKFYTRQGASLAGGSRQLDRLGYSGKGVGVAVIDSGIDGGHPDISFPERTVQNVKVLLGDQNVVSGTPKIQPFYLEGLSSTDIASGHGTHVAGIIGGDGTARPGYWLGMAPEANLIGVSVGDGSLVINSLGGFDYILENQAKYNIRVVNCSWGTTDEYSASDPVNIATKLLYEQGITVVFAAGNEGPADNTMNPFALAPWVISVGAVHKNGATLADFSSIGDPGDASRRPTLVAPGVNIVSTRSTLPLLGFTNINNLQVNWPYITFSGTSQAAPFVAGTVAGMLEANPTLTPAAVKSILSSTAQTLPGYSSYQVGAGLLKADRAIAVAAGKTIPVDGGLQVASVFPAHGAVMVSADAAITLSFTQPLDETSINDATVYLLDRENGELVPSISQYNAFTKTISLKPIEALGKSGAFMVVANLGLRNAAGAYAMKTFSSSFSTEACSLYVSALGCLQ